MSHVFFLLVSSFVVSAFSGPAHGSEIQCIGSVAHHISYSLNDAGEVDAVSIEPATEYANKCLSGIGMDKRICLGLNQDATCSAAKTAVLPMPLGTRCQDCFVGAETDIFYSLNISHFRVEHIGAGFRGTRLRSKIQIEDDNGRAPPPHKGSYTIGEKPFEWKLKIAGRELATLRVSMPTEIYYEDNSRGGEHTDGGVNLDIDLGENSIQYLEGKGWEHHHDKAKVTLRPIVEGDYNVQNHLTVGIKSKLQLEVVDVMWFHVNIAPEVPLAFTSVGSSGAADLVHACVDGGLNFDLGHEADIKFSFLNRTIAKHWGPSVDRHYRNPSVVHKCVDIHRKKPASILVV